MEKGIVQEVEGGRQATEWLTYLRSFNHPQMLRPAHVCYGFHPGAQITGQIGEDERVWGCTQWGFGAIGSVFIPPVGIFAPATRTALPSTLPSGLMVFRLPKTASLWTKNSKRWPKNSVNRQENNPL